jgi:hypothetical protein
MKNELTLITADLINEARAHFSLSEEEALYVQPAPNGGEVLFWDYSDGHHQDEVALIYAVNEELSIWSDGVPGDESSFDLLLDAGII